MFNQNDPRAWGKAAAFGGVAGMNQTTEAMRVRMATQTIDKFRKHGIRNANVPGMPGFQNVQRLRSYRAMAIHRLGEQIIG